ncbi:hypothetical protein [Fictibacillus terranigra]|uniref:Uncharacterized protein n=1 Tax=Fictibacillus terranigra TaxID=3058424 RepID=A0ABT8E365_9BACL|nr:hypothetical protein [Fictibacillus sp. CENA-BCM004]MDN4072330.1 hypothetical protein [Fictibacillus sp. CENA-BCM004]
MPNQENNSHNPIPHKNKKDDTYHILKQAMEMDTDVNEDTNRERLLDESFDSFLESNEQQEN